MSARLLYGVGFIFILWLTWVWNASCVPIGAGGGKRRGVIGYSSRGTALLLLPYKRPPPSSVFPRAGVWRRLQSAYTVCESYSTVYKTLRAEDAWIFNASSDTHQSFRLLFSGSKSLWMKGSLLHFSCSKVDFIVLHRRPERPAIGFKALF